MFTRRELINTSLVSFTGLAACGTPARATVKADAFAKARDAAEDFRKKYDVPGMSIAIARHEQLALAEGFGFADVEAKRVVKPTTLFRIASVSKPITSVALFRLIEQGKLRLTDHVFGADGILAPDYASVKLASGVDQLTVEQFMTHTTGGWQNDGSDPMFHHTDMNHHDLIAWTIANQPLTHTPGTHFAYSNFGYCVLGRVLEKLTGKSYAEAVKQQVLKPCGIRDMRITGNSREEAAAGETVYYDAYPDSPYGLPASRMDSHGGWLATPTDLVMFLTRVDEFPNRPDILRKETIDTMITGTTAAPGYAHGWSVNLKGRNYFHNGSLPGTAAIAVRTQGGYCWAAITNVRRPGTQMDSDLDRLMWRMVDSVTEWPNVDMFGAT